jgi:hypothetical protein
MEIQAEYKTANPRINRRFADTLAKFKAMRDLGYPLEQIRQNLHKEDLLALAIYFYEKSENTEGGYKTDYSEYEEVVNAG